MHRALRPAASGTAAICPLPQAGSVSGRSFSNQPARPPEAGDPSKKNGLVEHNDSPNGSHKDFVEGQLELSDRTLPAVWERLIQYLNEKAPILATQLKPVASPAIQSAQN